MSLSNEDMAGHVSQLVMAGLMAGHVSLFALVVRKLRHEFASHLENFSAALVALTSAH